MTGYRGRLAVFDRVSESLADDQDVGRVSIDEVRRIFGCDADNPMIGEIPVSPQQEEWFISKTGRGFDFDRFDYFFSLEPAVPEPRVEP